MTSFSMTTDAGVLTFDSYTIAPRVRNYAVEPAVGRLATRARVQGDLLEVPSAINVRVLIDEPSLSAAYVVAYQTLVAAASASSITTYEGTVTVNGILGVLFDVEQPHLFLTLSFAPVAP